MTDGRSFFLASFGISVFVTLGVHCVRALTVWFPR